MKIGIYNDWWYPDLVGGTERSALEISQGIVAHYGPDQVVIVSLSNTMRTSKSVDHGVHLFRVGSFTLRRHYSTTLGIRVLERFRIGFDLLSPLRVARTFSRQGVKVVIVHNMDRLGVKFVYLLKMVYGIRVIRIMHDLSDTCIRRTRYHKGATCAQTCFGCKPKSFVYKHLAAACFDAVICNSKFTMEKLSNLQYVAKDIDYGYVELPRKDDKIDFVKRISSEKIARVGYVGRFSPEKGIEVLIESLQALRVKHRIDSELFLIGKGNASYVSDLKQLVSKSGIVASFFEYSNAPYDFLRSRVDLIVIPSEWEETLGRVAYEASINGFQVMVSDIGGLPEAAALSGNDFFAFTPGDIDDLAQKIRCFVLGEKPNRTGTSMSRPILKRIISRMDNF